MSKKILVAYFSASGTTAVTARNLAEYDFSGKTVIPFVTHGTGGMAGTIYDMTASLPGSAVVLESIGISRSEMEGAQETVNGWLD